MNIKLALRLFWTGLFSKHLIIERLIGEVGDVLEDMEEDEAHYYIIWDTPDGPRQRSYDIQSSELVPKEGMKVQVNFVISQA